MGLFGKKKKSSDCCTVTFEEVKPDNTKKPSCCDIQIEDVKEEKKKEKVNRSSCCG